MTDYEYFLKKMKAYRLENFLFHTFEEAKKSKMRHSIVVMPDEEKKHFDVYVTAFKNGQFGEYAAWVDDEFKEDDELLENVINFIIDVYRSDDITRKIKNVNPNLYFTSYQRA